jgi:hypothetical protein
VWTLKGVWNFRNPVVQKFRLKKLVYYEEIKRELNRRPIYECRCDERRKGKDEGSTRPTYTGWRGGLEHLKIETRLIDERFCECDG